MEMKWGGLPPFTAHHISIGNTLTLHVVVCVDMVADVSETRPELVDSFNPGLLLSADFLLAGVGSQGAA